MSVFSVSNDTQLLDLVGQTPLVRLRNFDTGPCALFAKLESQNPGASIKDRPARAMIEQAERDGHLKPGGLIVEATAGNTGLSLTLIGAQKGYRTLLVVPDKMAREKILHLKALGAEVVITRSDVGKGHPDYYQDVAARIAQQTPGAIYINQFANPANPLAHETSTGPEILSQMDGDVDAVVVGVGSGGTLSGIGRYMAKHSPKTAMVLADPKGSILAPFLQTGEMIEPGSWAVEGIGEDFIPPICDLSYVKHAYTVSDAESFAAARELLLKEGLMGGSSSGTLLAAALRYCREQTTPKRVVTFVCDSGTKYLSKVYNDAWLAEEGLVERERNGSIGDLLLRRHGQGDTITVKPDETLRTAFSRMKASDVSQLPVMEGERIVGLIDESDILEALLLAPEASFTKPVRDVMVTKLQTVDADAPIRSVLGLFKDGYVGIVMRGEHFLGLVTRTDLINHLRRGGLS